MNASESHFNKTIVIAMIFLAVFSLKYVYFIKNHSLDNNEGDDKTFIIYGDKIAKGQLTPEDKIEIYGQLHKPLLVLASAVLVKLGLIRHYLLVPFAFDMLLFLVVYWALSERTGNFVIAAGGSILASWSSLLGYYSFQYLPEMPFASSIIAFTYFFDRFLETRKERFMYLSAFFFSLTALFRLESIIVIALAAAAYALKNLKRAGVGSKADEKRVEGRKPNPAGGSPVRGICTLAAIGLLIVACFFAIYVYWVEGSIGLGDIPLMLQRLNQTQEVVMVEHSTISKGILFYLPYMLLLAFTPLPCLLALIGMSDTFRKRGLFDMYLFTFLVLLLERWIIYYLGKGAQKYLTCFIPFLAIFAGLGAAWTVKAVGKKLKLGRAAKYILAAAIMACAIYSSYAWIHQPIPGSKDLGYGNLGNAMVIATPLYDSYLWDQSIGQKDGYLLFRDGLRDYRSAHPAEFEVVYTNIDLSLAWIKAEKTLEQIELRNISEYRNGEGGLFVVIVPSGVYIPSAVFQEYDGTGRKMVFMTPLEHSNYRFAYSYDVNPSGYT
jgi:hypothetical protein